MKRKKLNKLFRIKRMTVQGGGLTNGSFLNAGLIDELSLIIVPVADGEIGTQSVFDIHSQDKKKQSVKLKLKSSKQYRKECLWLRFAISN